MSYEPLHHKYRPQTFAELVGQDAIATTLANALQQQRIAPAYLFTGARGTGKTSSARILAKSLNCLASEVPTPQPCGSCETCRTIAGGTALDVIEIDAASNTGVDNIREVIERAQFAPVQCRYKVYIIDEVHMLSTAAFNALLKTLEEPPNRVVFVLATTDPQRVLPTIISRCQRFDFRRIPLEAMVTHLSHIAQQETIAITPEAIQLVAQIAQGGLRDAESLLDQLSLIAGEVTVERVWDLVGAVPERELMALLRGIIADNPEVVLDRARSLMDRGREPLIVLQNLASFYRDLLIACTAPQRGDLTALTPTTWQQLCEFARSWDASTILAGQQHLRVCELQVKNSSQPRLWLEVALLGLLPSALASVVMPSPVQRVPPANILPSQPAIATPPPTKEVHAPTTTQTTISQPKSTTNSNGQQPPSPPVAPSTPSQKPTTTPPPHSSSAQSPLPPLPTQPTKSNLGQVGARQPQATHAGQSSLPPDELGRIWQQVMGTIHLLTRGLLSEHGSLLAINGNEVRIGISAETLLKPAQSQIKKIEEAFKAVLQREVKVTILVVSPLMQDAPVLETGSTPPAPPQSSSPYPPSPPTKKSTKVNETAADAHPAIVPPHSAPDPETSSPVHPSEPDLPPSPNPSISMGDPSQELQEVLRSAKNLADHFNGVVVALDESSADSDQLLQDADLSETYADSDLDSDLGDVPF